MAVSEGHGIGLTSSDTLPRLAALGQRYTLLAPFNTWLALRGGWKYLKIKSVLEGVRANGKWGGCGSVGGEG